MIKISLSELRRIMLASQGLLNPPQRAAVKEDVLAVIRRLHLLQIDTIHVVARSPDLVLWSHLGDYEPFWLDELLAEGALFEYWAHAACFLPIEDFPLYRLRMLNNREESRMSHYWTAAEHSVLIERTLARIRLEGALRSADFENHNTPAGGWGNWKEEKLALEHLFDCGMLMIARREKFQRVYDLQERVLPGWDDARALTAAEVQREQVLRTVRALGVVRADRLPAYFYLAKKSLPALIKDLTVEGFLAEVNVEGWQVPAYIHSEDMELLEEAASGALRPTLTTLLAPFDPLLTDRARTREVFGFDYTLECYLPGPRRRYGYYTLPILHHGELVGRMEAKAHRSKGIFEVRGLWLEPTYELEGELAQELSDAVTRLAAWHRTPEVVGFPEKVV
jgi:uncharacterized protein YcaQ